MEIITNEKINFNTLEENTFKKMMELGRNLIRDDLKLIDDLIKKYRDRATFKVKDIQPTTVKTKLGEIEFFRRRYEMNVNGVKKYIYLLDELLEINEFGQFSQGIIDMIVREITKKSYRETAKTVSQDTDCYITYSAVRNIILALGDKIKKLEEEKIDLYNKGLIEGTREVEYVFCEHDGIYIKKQKSKKSKKKNKIKLKNFKKKNKKKKNGIELKIAVIHEGKEKRYSNDYRLKNKIVVGTVSKSSELKKIEDATIGTRYKEYAIKNVIINGDGADWTASIVEGSKEIFQLDMAHVQKKIFVAISDENYLKQMQEIVYSEKPLDILSLIYNYKVELENDEKFEELSKVRELENYLKNNQKGLLRYQYKLGYTEKDIKENLEQFPTLGSEESQMYCVCRDRMKKNRTSWSIEGAEAILKVITAKINQTIEEIITKKAESRIKEELQQRVPEPKRRLENKYNEIRYIDTNRIMENITKKNIKNEINELLKTKECSELILQF